MMASDGKPFAIMFRRWMCALATTPSLSAAELRCALVMLDASNHKRFTKDGKLVSWLGNPSIAVKIGLSERSVKTIRTELYELGIVGRSNKGGLKPGGQGGRPAEY